MPLTRFGQQMIVEHKVPDRNGDLYIRARLFDSSGAELGVSPISLSHITDGLYRNDTVAMPETDQVTVITAVFYDAAFSISAEEDYTDGVDVFERVDDLVKTNVVVPRSDEIFVEFEAIDLVVLVDEPDSIEVLIESSEIDVFIDGSELNIEFDSNEMTVEIES